MDVFAMKGIVSRVSNPVVHITPLPDFSTETGLSGNAKRKTTFNELDGTLESDLRSWSKEQVHVTWHDYEFVELEFSLFPIGLQSGNEKIAILLHLKDGAAGPGVDR
jgi:hypothetical protein